jgi:carboxymethylenebutenolidase
VNALRILAAAFLLLAAPNFLSTASAQQTAETPQTAPAAKETFKGEKIFLRDFGGDELAYLSIPQSAPELGLVIAPDGHGLGARVRRFCDALANAGYLALAVDLTNGRTAETPEAAAALLAGIDPAVATKALEAGLSFYQKSPRFRMNRVALITLGGADAFGLRLASGKRGRELSALSMINPASSSGGEALRIRTQRLHSADPTQDWSTHIPALRSFWNSQPARKHWFESLLD